MLEENNNFDCLIFAKSLSELVTNVVPDDLSASQVQKLTVDVYRYSLLTGEALLNRDDIVLTESRIEFITQILAEWICHKSVDMCRANISAGLQDKVLETIAFYIYDVSVQCVERNYEDSEILSAVEHWVAKIYKAELEKLKLDNYIPYDVYEFALEQSHIDEYAKQKQLEKDIENKIYEYIPINCFITDKDFTQNEESKKSLKRLTTTYYLYYIAVVLLGVFCGFIWSVNATNLDLSFINALVLLFTNLKFWVLLLLVMLAHDTLRYVFCGLSGLETDYVKKIENCNKDNVVGLEQTLNAQSALKRLKLILGISFCFLLGLAFLAWSVVKLHWKFLLIVLISVILACKGFFPLDFMNTIFANKGAILFLVICYLCGYSIVNKKDASLNFVNNTV